MKRSLSLDILKLVMSFFIIIAHIQPLFEKDSLIGWILVNGFSRTAVPCFFIITGYFIVNKLNDKKAILKLLKHAITIYIVWSLFYGLDYFSWAGTKTIILRLLFGYYHLWYMSALILGIVILVVCKKYIKNDLFLITIALLLFIFGHLLDSSREMAQQYRNGLFYGFPYLAIGYILSKYNVINLLKSQHLVLIILIGGVLIALETYLLRMQGTGTDMHISSLFFCSALILFVLKTPLPVKGNIATEYFGYLSAGVYFIHPYIMTWFGVLSEYNIVNVIPVFFASILVSIPIIFLNKRLKIIL